MRDCRDFGGACVPWNSSDGAALLNQLLMAAPIGELRSCTDWGLSCPFPGIREGSINISGGERDEGAGLDFDPRALLVEGSGFVAIVESSVDSWTVAMLGLGTF